MRAVVALCCALLPACAAVAPPVKDDGRMEISWVRVDDVHAVCQGLSGRTEFLTILGCSRWSAEQRRCEIYAPAPRDERDLQRFATLGHELMHCFQGNWHDRWGRMHDSKARHASVLPPP